MKTIKNIIKRTIDDGTRWFDSGDVKLLLIATILTWGIGDFVTTWLALSRIGLAEGNPIGTWILDKYGFPGLALAKLIGISWFTSSIYIGRMTDRGTKAGIALGLFIVAWIGIYITLFNTMSIFLSIFNT